MNRTHRIAAALVVAAASTVALSACGGGGQAAASGCTTDVTFTNADGTDVAVTSTGAVSLAGGAGYTIYAADFDLDLENVSLFSSPVVPDGQNLATIAITVFNPTTDPEPITAGTTVEASTEFDKLVFVVTSAQGTEFYGNNAGAAGLLTVTEVGDTVCIELDYSDDEKQISGTVAAAVKDL